MLTQVAADTGRSAASLGTIAQPETARIPAVTDRSLRSPDGEFQGRAYVVAIVAISAVTPVVGFQRWASLLAAIGFACAVAGLRRPGLGLLGIGTLCTLDPLISTIVFSDGLLPWNTFNYYLLLVAILWAPLLLRRSELPLRIIQACAALLALELLISQSRPRGAQDFLGMFAVFGLFACCARARLTRSDWYWLGIVCGTLSAIGGLLYLMQRASLPQINPNAWATFPLGGLFTLCLALPFSFGRRRGPLIVSALAASSLVWVFLSGSRGNMLVALACAAYILVGVRGIGRRAMLVGSTCLVMIAAATQFSDLQERALGRVNVLLDRRTALVNRTSHRSELLLGGWYVFLEHPLGVGTGGFTGAWQNLGRRDGLPPYDGYRQKDAHAGWIKILAENGIPGFLLLLSFALSFAAVGLRRRHRVMRRLGLFTTAALLLEFVSAEYQNKAIWLLAAATIVMLGRTSPLLALRSRRRT